MTLRPCFISRPKPGSKSCTTIRRGATAVHGPSWPPNQMSPSLTMELMSQELTKDNSMLRLEPWRGVTFRFSQRMSCFRSHKSRKVSEVEEVELIVLPDFSEFMRASNSFERAQRTWLIRGSFQCFVHFSQGDPKLHYTGSASRIQIGRWCITGVFMTRHLMHAPAFLTAPTSKRRWLLNGCLRLLSTLAGWGPMNSDWKSSILLFLDRRGLGGKSWLVV
jgi:hypothetical protein